MGLIVPHGVSLFLALIAIKKLYQRNGTLAVSLVQVVM